MQLNSMPKATQNKLLLSSVCKPFGAKHGDGFGTSYEGSHQTMWAQGLFRPRATTTQWGIDFIAHNLEIPTTTLHYPTMKQFIREIRKGYEYIGIAFVSPVYHKMVPMVEAIRKHAPQTKVILGGYGTTLPAAEKLEPYADHICRGEGVQFMRELLGENVDRPIEQPVVTQTSKLFSMQLGTRMGYVFAGLGCPNGCDFCATSHYFKRKHIRFLPTGPSILGAIERLRGIYPDMTDFWINDEDFLLNQKRGRGFLEAIRESDLPPLALSIFGSVKALSQFTPAELVEMGVDWIWVGYEGERAGYAKMNGVSYRDLFADLHKHGISVLASMIIGFDYQTPEIIRDEFEELMSLRPTMSQFLIYGPAYETPLFDRMNKEGRLLESLRSDHSKHDGFALTFKHPHIGVDEMEALQRQLYRDEFAQLGPGVFRVAEDCLEGYVNLKNHPTRRVREKAEAYRERCHPVLQVLEAAKRYLNPEVCNWVDELGERLVAETGPLTFKERIIAKAAPAILWYTDYTLRHEIGAQPKFTQRRFRQGILDKVPAVADLEPRPIAEGVGT